MNSTALSLLALASMLAFGKARPSGGDQKSSSHLSPSVIADALYCMEGENSDASTISRSEQAFRVKYIYGVVDPKVDMVNELHLISYKADMKSAWLYELLMERTGSSGVTLTWINTARLEHKEGRWVIEDTLGGVYSYQRIQNLVLRISGQDEQLVSTPTTKPQALVCKSH